MCKCGHDKRLHECPTCFEVTYTCSGKNVSSIVYCACKKYDPVTSEVKRILSKQMQDSDMGFMTNQFAFGGDKQFYIKIKATEVNDDVFKAR